MNCLANPSSGSKLARAYEVWCKRTRRTEQAQPLVKRTKGYLNNLRQVEDYLYPLPDRDWLEKNDLANSDPEAFQHLLEFRPLVRRWHAAALLPIDQVILTLAQDLFSEPADLAIAHKLASSLRHLADTHPTWRLPELSQELETIARNKRRFIGFSEDDAGLNPESYRGRVLLTTMHKAKGLEWDRVYLLSVNNYDFPSGAEYDSYNGEKWFLRDHLNLEEEALAQLKTALSKNEYDWYEEGSATRSARANVISERLRLLYVGITRAKKALIVTWNTGRNGKQLPALPFMELLDCWQKEIANNPLPPDADWKERTSA